MERSHGVSPSKRASSHTRKLSSPPPSVATSAAKCPIRFLDQESPEKVAQYFEEHKHEIPRSHEVCVRRYQTNEASIRELDAKYGNLVSMIRGLAPIHQPLLPEKQEEQPTTADQASVERVHNWAQSVDSKATPALQEDESAKDGDERIGHFERDLEEVRLGESPSRPWGIRVPIDAEQAENMSSPARGNSMLDGTGKDIDQDLGSILAGPLDASAAELAGKPTAPGTSAAGVRASPPGRCPFSHMRQKPPSDNGVPPLSVASSMNTTKSKRSGQSARPPANQMVFNGPVFFGYPAEQAALFMSQLGGSSQQGGNH